MQCNNADGSIKSTNPVFTSDEALYRGFTQLHLEDTKRFPAISLSFNNCSVNRGSIAKPHDLLFDHPHHGIFMLHVGILPTQINVEAGEFTAQMVHQPERDTSRENFSHSIIQIQKDDTPLGEKVPNSVSKAFRIKLDAVLDQAWQERILHNPDQAPPVGWDEN